mgnify:CR=1 FL=1
MRVDTAGIVETVVELERQSRQATQVDFPGDAVAKERRGAVQAFQNRIAVRAAKRHHECRRIAQVGADPDFGDRNRHTVETGVVRFAPVKQLHQPLTAGLGFATLHRTLPLKFRAWLQHAVYRAA